MKYSFFKLSALLMAAFSVNAMAEDATVTATWAFASGSSNETAAVVSTDNVLSYATFSIGSNLYFNGVQTVSSLNFSKVHPTETIGSGETNAVAANSISFAVKPKKGITFTPTSISFDACKLGTSGGTVYVKASSGSSEASVASALDPSRNNASPYYTSYSLDIDLGDLTDEVIVNLYITNLANNKDIGISNIVLEGTYTGEAEVVASYTLATSLSDDNAGVITSNPSGDSFDEGTAISLTASENFGYHFQKWVDADNNTVSTENPYSFSIEANTTLQAVYTKNNVYALNVALEGGAKSHMISYSPVGNVVGDVHYYEEGTEVRLIANSNRILTFTSWDDNSTSSSRDLVINSTTNVTANYSCEDFIVGWDMYYDSPSSERAAEFTDESDNAGKLSLRNEAGETTSWLAMGVTKGAQNGKYGARVWKLLTAKDYFEISFSSKGYYNLVLAATLGDDYNAYSTMYAQWSTDGENFTTFGTFTLPYRNWTSDEFALPSDVDDQTKVWIRFYPDYESDLAGATSDYDGTSVTDIYVLADKTSATDETAPVLVSSIPAADATGVSASGSIVLTFDEKVQAGTGSATLDGEALSATISAKTAIFKYTGLAYNTTYTFTLPEGVVTDRNGNAFAGTTFSFTTMERTQPEARLYDAVVAADGSGDYLTIIDAIEAAPTGRIKPWLIFIKEGTYTGHHSIPASKPYLHFIGQGQDKVFISDELLCGGDNAYKIDDGATLTDKGENTYFEGVSFVNSYGLEKNAGPQALALNTNADRIIFNRCGMYSYQDTYYTGSYASYRVYVKDCWIEGAVDFIYGQGDVYFDNDTINIVRSSGGYIVAPSHDSSAKWGYVFMNNVITAVGEHATDTPSETSVWFGRPWHEQPLTVFINTKCYVTIPAAGWYETMGGLPKIWADYNSMDGDGNLLDLSNRRDTYYYTNSDGEKVYGTAKNYLTDEEAAEYTLKNVTGGEDGWQPDLITERCATPVVAVDGTTLSWAAVDYAICYVIEKDGVVVDFTTETSISDYDSTSTYRIFAANEYGGLSDAAVVKSAAVETAIKSVEGQYSIRAIYSIDGTRQNGLRRGLNIVEYVDESGNVVVKKIINK